jgi:hypothetical protein
MPPKSKISRLPDAVKAELNQKLRESSFGDLVEISQWLTSIGYPVGKSGVGVYAKNNKNKILSTSDLITKAAIPAASVLATQRLACLHAALKMRPENEALAYADELILWAYQ